MCVVSMVIDDWRNRTPWKLPIEPLPTQPINPDNKTYPFNPASQEEVDALKGELEALKKLLKAAKTYDEETGQPGCEKEELVQALKTLAKEVGVDLQDVLE